MSFGPEPIMRPQQPAQPQQAPQTPMTQELENRLDFLESVLFILTFFSTVGIVFAVAMCLALASRMN